MTDRPTITVIGAGMVGACCALYLQNEGFEVTLLDRGGPGEGASSGNLGGFGVASCPPAAMPGVLGKVPAMLLDAGAPLRIRWSHAARALPWFLRFVANSRRVRRHAEALFPALKSDRITEWIGPRPSHPDSKPVIGRSPRHRNAWFAFGHDHLGLTMGGITGRLISELVTGKTPSVDLSPFRPDRFQPGGRFRSEPTGDNTRRRAMG